MNATSDPQTLRENKSRCEQDKNREASYKERFFCLACKQTVTQIEIGKHSCPQMREKSHIEYAEAEFIKLIDTVGENNNPFLSKFNNCGICSKQISKSSRGFRSNLIEQLLASKFD